MHNRECSKNRGFREVQISIFTGSHVSTLELNNKNNRRKI